MQGAALVSYAVVAALVVIATGGVAVAANTDCVEKGLCYADSLSGVDLVGHCTALAPCRTLQFTISQIPLSWFSPSHLWLTGQFDVDNKTLALGGCLSINGTYDQGRAAIRQGKYFIPSSLSKSLIYIAPPSSARCGVTIFHVDIFAGGLTALDSAITFAGPPALAPTNQPQHIIRDVGIHYTNAINASNVNLMIEMVLADNQLSANVPFGMYFNNSVVEMNDISFDGFLPPVLKWEGGVDSFLKVYLLQIHHISEAVADSRDALLEFYGGADGTGFGQGMTVKQVIVGSYNDAEGPVYAIANVTCNNGAKDCDEPIVFDSWSVTHTYGEPNAWFAFDHVTDITVSHSGFAFSPGDVSPLASVFALNGHVGLTLDGVLMFENGATECDDTCYQLTCNGTRNSVTVDSSQSGVPINSSLVLCDPSCILTVNNNVLCQP